PEQYSYSVLWLTFGVILLRTGLHLRSPALRFPSPALVILTVLKVLLVDMHGLTAIYQALSFIGPRVPLLAIGRLYQRPLLPPPVRVRVKHGSNDSPLSEAQIASPFTLSVPGGSHTDFTGPDPLN